MISGLMRGPRSLLLLLVLYLIGLWGMSVPLTGDQKVYLSIALEMKEHGEIIIPYLFDRANFLKPPFQYWMTLLGWKLFGVSLFGALLPSVLAMIGSAYLVKKISNEDTYLPAIAFASTLGVMTYGTTAQMEIWIVLLYLFAWSLWKDKRPLYALLVVGAMAWVKGPLYPVLWGMSVFLYEALYGRLGSTILRTRFLIKLLAGVVVGILWYFLASLQYQKEMLEVFLGRENFGKLQTPQGSPFGLWGEFTFSLFPVLFYFLYGTFVPGFSERFKANKNFYISFGLIPALFFTIFPYRVGTYLFLLTPLVVWITHVSFDQIPNWVKRSGGGITLLIAISAAFFLFRLLNGGWLGIEIVFPMIICFFVWSYAHFKANRSVMLISSLLIVTLVRLGAIEIGEWDLKDLRAVVEQHHEVAYLIEPDHEDIWHEFGLISSAIGIDIMRKKNLLEIETFFAKGGVLILSDEQTAQASSLQCEPWTRLKRRMKFPLRELVVSGLSIENPDLHRIYQLCRGFKTPRQ